LKKDISIYHGREVLAASQQQQSLDCRRPQKIFRINYNLRPQIHPFKFFAPPYACLSGKPVIVTLAEIDEWAQIEYRSRRRHGNKLSDKADIFFGNCNLEQISKSTVIRANQPEKNALYLRRRRPWHFHQRMMPRRSISWSQDKNIFIFQTLNVIKVFVICQPGNWVFG
jgi:hypothetical protein